MLKHTLSLFSGSFAITMALTCAQVSSAEALRPSADYEIIKIKTETGTESLAAFFDGGHDQVAIFVPGAVFNKESWFDLAERLKKLDIASLSLDGNTRDAVWAAVDLLTAKEFTKIILVGGSMGGAAILGALETRTDESISKIILLAPVGGPPVRSTGINKLFIVSKEDQLGIYSFVKALYEHSLMPKKFVEVDGSEHAQHLFNSSHKEAVTKLILDFVNEDA